MRTFFHTPKLSALAILLLMLPLSTKARDDLTGTWIEEYSETIVSVEQWSPVCGPSPKSTGRRNRGLEFRIEDQGIALKFIGSKKTFSTADCQTDNKAVQPKERTVKKKLFMISCSTPENSNPYENGLYSFRIRSPERIEYRETTRFSRNASGSMCVHTMRKRRVYKKTAAEVEGSKLSEKDSTHDESSSSSTLLPSSNHQPDPCQNPGAVTSVFIEPSILNLTPGDKACVKTSASDSNACPVKASLGWAEKAKRPKGIKLSEGRCFVVSKNTPAGKYMLRLQASGVGVSLTLNVVKIQGAKDDKAPRSKSQGTKSRLERDQGDLSDAGTRDSQDTDAGRTNLHDLDSGSDGDRKQAMNFSKQDTVQSDPRTLQDFLPVDVENEGSKQGLPSWVFWVLPAGLGALALLLFLALLLVLHKRSSKPTAPGEPSSSNTTINPVVSRSSDPVSPGSQPPKPQRVMAPTRVEPLRPVVPDRQQPPKPQSEDSVLLSSSEKKSEPKPSSVVDPQKTKFCIGCGKSLPADAKFCPYCAQRQE